METPSAWPVAPWLIAALGIAGALGFLPFLAELPPHLDAMRVLAAGARIVNPFYPIGYPVALAPSYALFGLDGVIAFQALLYALSLWLFWWWLARAGLSRRVMLVATAALALHPYLLLDIQRINDNAVNVLLMLILVGVMTDAWLWPTRKAAAALGAALGLLVATRPNAVALGLLPLALMATEAHSRARALIYGAAALAVIVGVSQVGTGAWLFVPGNGPYNLFAGTNPLTAAALDTSYNGEASVVPALAAAGVATDAPPALPAEVYYRLVARFVAEHPLQTVVLAGLKVANLFRPDWQFADDWLEVAAQTIVAMPVVLWVIAWSIDRSYRTSRRGLVFVAVNSDPRFRLPLDVVLLLETVVVLGRAPWLARRLGYSRAA